MKKYKGILIFLSKFVLIYGVLTFLYSNYLNGFDNIPDIFTKIVAKQSTFVMRILGYESSTEHHIGYPIMKFLLEGKYEMAIVEGCNAVSLMILFSTFVIAFSNEIKNLLWFLPFGLISIHFLNVLRVSLLGFLYTFYNSWAKVFHDYGFPIVIYGWIILLWIVWVKYFFDKKTDNKND